MCQLTIVLICFSFCTIFEYSTLFITNLLLKLKYPCQLRFNHREVEVDAAIGIRVNEKNLNLKRLKGTGSG